MRSRSKPAVQRSSKNVQSTPRLTWWHGVFFALGITVALGLQFFSPATAHSSLSNKESIPVPKGPWGDLEYTSVELERPDDTFADPEPPPAQITWLFGSMPMADVEKLVASCDFTEDQKKTILDKTRWAMSTNGLQFTPPVEFVRDMSLPARKAMYEVLGKIPLNAFICNPVLIDKDKLDEWLETSGLSKENQALVQRMSFEKNGQIAFFDSQLLDWVGTTPAERKRFAKAMTRTSALLMKLRITPESDLDGLLRYWGQGGRGESMRPLLESLGKVEAGTSISVSFFFPTFARMRLYTYPDGKNDKMAWHEDCFWTAMNFFNEKPDYSFFNPEQISSKLNTEYSAIKTNLTFGDLVMLVNSDKQAIHMCVYIADDVVFTKNGASFLAPWVLMKLPEMMKRYPSDKPLKMLAYRKKQV